MAFSCFQFLLWFLPFFFAVYWLLPDKYRNITTVVFSLVFFTYGSLDVPWHILLILVSLTLNYAIGTLIKKEKQKKAFLAAGITLNFGMLVIFKYTDFIFSGVSAGIRIFNKEFSPIPALGIIMPVGISFFTFQAVSWLTDIYRGKYEKFPSVTDYFAYMLMFPQFVSGPIVRYEKIESTLYGRSFSFPRFFEGLKKLAFGLGFKVIFADMLGRIWTDIRGIGFSSISVPLAWMGIIGYSLQLYFDFMGYSLMAVGLGEMMGVAIPKNFDNPYISRSMTEFWRRWHITLGSWFRDYVYIPLGGNRKGRGRTYLNLLAVWLFTGIWHGASMNFVLWGLLLFAVIALEKSGFGRFLEKHNVFSHVYMTFLIPVSWLVFAVSDMKELGIYFGRLFGFGGENVFAGDFIKYGKTYGLLLILGIVLATGLPEKCYRKIERKKIIVIPLMCISAGLSCYCIYKGLNDPFMYFRF